LVTVLIANEAEIDQLELLKKYCGHAERRFLMPDRGSAFGEASAKEHVRSDL
jgi:hypothetical protein